MTQPISPPAEPIQVHVIKKRRRWPWIVGIFLALTFGYSLGTQEASDVVQDVNAEPVPAETVTVAPGAHATVTVTAKPPKPTGTIPGSGTFIVGADVKPGTYRTQGGDTCYWARSKGTSGEVTDIIANDNVTGPTVVTIKSSDGGFKTSGCGDWVPVKK